MPEGPEIRWMSELINKLAENGTVHFSHLSRSVLATHERKHPPVEIPSSWAGFTVRARPRGKELQVVLEGFSPALKRRKTWPAAAETTRVTLLFRAGMSGNFMMKEVGEEFPKHAHLRFHVADADRAICFVDPRRFGSWQVSDEWGPPSERGPDILDEPEAFILNVQRQLTHRAFDSAIAEVLLDQQFFNGIGNYLRAEILHRADISPFVRARDVLSAVTPQEDCQPDHDDETTKYLLASGLQSFPAAVAMLARLVGKEVDVKHAPTKEIPAAAAKITTTSASTTAATTAASAVHIKVEKVDGEADHTAPPANPTAAAGKRGSTRSKRGKRTEVKTETEEPMIAAAAAGPEGADEDAAAISATADAVLAAPKRRTCRKSSTSAAAGAASATVDVAEKVEAAAAEPTRTEDKFSAEEERGAAAVDDVELPARGSVAATLYATCIQVLAESLSVLRVHGFYDDSERAKATKASNTAVPTFHDWLRCYTKQADAVDGIGRRVWFAAHHRGVKSLVKRRPSAAAGDDGRAAEGRAAESSKGKGKSKKRESSGGRKVSAPAVSQQDEKTEEGLPNDAEKGEGTQPRIKRAKSAKQEARVKSESVSAPHDTTSPEETMRSASRAAMGLRRLKTVS